jgi:OmcA/MtrC family decaheme c-type cytochrome
MRIPSSVLTAARYGLGLAVIAGSVVLIGATKKTEFTLHDKEFYANANVVNFVRPGLVITVVQASIAADGTMSVDFKLTDPKGLPLDTNGVYTPGPVSLSFLVAYIPKGETQLYDYITRTQTSPITKVTAIQASSESMTTGTLKQVSDGEYLYTFKQKAVAKGGGAWDPTATHRVGVYGSRNLTEFDLGTNYDDATASWVPAGGPLPANNRDVIRTASCNKCHDSLAFHGGSRKSMDLCIMCHTPQTLDPDTGNTVDMKVFIHKIHAGSTLPSVQAGGKYQIIGFNQAVSDWSTVVMPSDVRRCAFCHESTTGAAQADNWLTKPGRAACGSCHDDVNFDSGKNHAGGLPQPNDNQCAMCHIPQGELEFDASIKGAHTIPTQSATAPGVNVDIVKVENALAGQKPFVTFTVRDNSGAGIPMSSLTTSPDRIGLVLAGPTSDYGYTNFGSDVTTGGYVSENPASTSNLAKCSPDGTCTYSFLHAIPADAKGTFAIGIEARRGLVLLPGTEKEQSTEYGAVNKVKYFSVDGSPVVARRQVVDVKSCNGCHSFLSLHGENRNQIEMCVLCHNPSETDKARRPTATDPAERTKPNQAVNFALMIHKIHTGEDLKSAGASYTVIGFGGSVNDFTDVRYPTMSPTGATGDTTKCYMCHVNNSEAVFPIGKNKVTDPQGLVTPNFSTTSACTACHLTKSAMGHAASNTDPTFGETCDVCHAQGSQFDVIKEHAGK